MGFDIAIRAWGIVGQERNQLRKSRVFGFLSVAIGIGDIGILYKHTRHPLSGLERVMGKRYFLKFSWLKWGCGRKILHEGEGSKKVEYRLGPLIFGYIKAWGI